jgi:hypothetical protein
MAEKGRAEAKVALSCRMVAISTPYLAGAGMPLAVYHADGKFIVFHRVSFSCQEQGEKSHQ